MNIIKLDFERDSSGKVIFSEPNLNKLNKYVLPIKVTSSLDSKLIPLVLLNLFHI